jgi:hypothetical protein
VPKSIEDSKLVFKRPATLTDQNDAGYFQYGTNSYALDGVSIAAQIVRELDSRKFDWRFRLKSLFLNHTSTADVRRNLVRIMQEDFRVRTWYSGAEETSLEPDLSPVYTFTCEIKEDGTVDKQPSDNGVHYCHRYGGLFHVWNWDPQFATMKDVDQWHPRNINLNK